MKILRIFAFGLSFALLALTATIVFMFGGEDERKDRRCSDKTMALIMSQDFVKRELKSPSTAKFPSIHRDGVRVNQTGDCKFRVSAYVDAQNGFGAVVRTRYVMDIERLSKSQSWRNNGLIYE